MGAVSPPFPWLCWCFTNGNKRQVEGRRLHSDAENEVLCLFSEIISHTGFWKVSHKTPTNSALAEGEVSRQAPKLPEGALS